MLIENILNRSTEEEYFSCVEFPDFLDKFKCRSKVTKSNVEEIVYEIARQKLIQKPHIMAGVLPLYGTHYGNARNFQQLLLLKNSNFMKTDGKKC